MVYAHLAKFDPTRDFETLTFFRANGVAFERGAPFSKDAVDARTLKLLYDNRKIGYAEPTEEEAAGVFAPAIVKAVGGGWYEVSVPWVDSAEKVQGQDRANFRATQLRDAGEPLDHHGVVIVEVAPDSYRVNAEWLAEPEGFESWDAAYARATDLRKAGAPEPAKDAGQPSIDDRAQALSNANTDAQLRALAKQIDEARAKADPPLDPLGVKSSSTKDEIARLIVEANGDKPPAESGGANGGTA